MIDLWFVDEYLYDDVLVGLILVWDWWKFKWLGIYLDLLVNNVISEFIIFL